MANEVKLGTFYDGFCGGSYTCYLIYDNPTRSGDNITINNIKTKVVANQSWGTEGRLAVSFSLPSGTSRVNNGTIANSYTYPTNNTVTLSSSITVSNLTTSISYSISFSDTGYGTSWNSNYSASFSGSISCPARTYSVSYNANGGSGAPSAQTKTYNVTLTLSSTKPTRTGYSFLGWATSSGGSVAYASGASYTGNANLSLYAVWQAQVSTITTASNADLNSTCSIKWSPKVSTNKYRLYFYLGNNWNSGMLPSSSDFIAGSSSDITYTSYTLPITVANYITSSSTATMSVTLYTYDSNGTQLGTDTKTFTVTVPSSTAPTVTQYSSNPYVASVSDNTAVNTWGANGVYVAGYSKIVAKASGTAQYGASIVKVDVSGAFTATASASYISTTSGVITTSGTKTVTFTVTDSRGYTASHSETVTFVGYQLPQITMLRAERDTSTPPTSLATVIARITATCASVGTNTLTSAFVYKQTTDTAWTTISDVILLDGTAKTLTPSFSDSHSYNFKATITDSVGNSATMTVIIPTIEVWMHQPAGGHGVAWGKISETGNFEIGYDLEVYGDITTAGDVTATGDITATDATFEDAVVDTLVVDTVDHTITDAEYLDLARLLANNYSTTKDYYVGEFCIYNAKVWECNTAVSWGETWTAAHWTELGSA